MKKIIIVGAGGFGRMIYSWIPDFYKDEGWEILGFIDDKLDAMDNYDYSTPVIETIENYYPEEDHVLAMAIADPKSKLYIAELLEQRGAEFINLVHPTAIIGENVQIGRGTIISPNATFTCDIKMGDFVIVNIGVTIGHDVIIGDGCTFSSHVDITGNTNLGRGVFLGSHSVVTPNVKIGAFAKIGAGSVVFTRVKPETTVFGNPAKRI